MGRCTFTPRDGGLALTSPYDPGFVGSLKARVPANARTWDGSRKVWIIRPDYAVAVADLCDVVFGERPAVPQASTAPAKPEIKVFRLEYLGQCKARDDGSVSAYGYADGGWSVIAPEPVLRRWFEGGPAGPPRAGVGRETLYGLLGVPQDADAAAVKAGYRRMARQWHPDACHEPNAQEMFVLIKGAYDVLSDPLKRKKYDAGLFFEANEQQRHMPAQFSAYAAAYRAPLRCGMVVAEAVPTLGRWVLSSIVGWQDITDLSGRVMVASWDRDNDRIKVEWVQP